MTSRRNLGPALALGGGAVALIAAIAGLLIVGGPGDARNRRLDEMTDERVQASLDALQCAFNGSGATPASIDDALNTRGWRTSPNDPESCRDWRSDTITTSADGAPPKRSGEISYTRLSASSIRICAFYQGTAQARPCESCYTDKTYDAYFAARPAGSHCYDIDLVQQPVVNYWRRSGDNFRIVS
jgi:hypothetical protein